MFLPDALGQPQARTSRRLTIMLLSGWASVKHHGPAPWEFRPGEGKGGTGLKVVTRSVTGRPTKSPRTHDDSGD